MDTIISDFHWVINCPYADYSRLFDKENYDAYNNAYVQL